MYRALQLGAKALGDAAPNPAVGAVLVHGSRIIGEGWTSPYGGPHAEVNAINSVLEKSALKEATLYVTLEPCSHFGKTPPCSDLIIQHQIPEVIIGLQDPFDAVDGSGIRKLREAGVTVTTGVLEQACREHHKRFLSLHERKRPYIILKWAMTSDGHIAPHPSKRPGPPEPFWISNTAARSLVHYWRGQEQAILVGTRTAVEDNPILDTRRWPGKNPIRILIDRSGKVPEDYHLKNGKVPTRIYTEKEGPANENTSYKILNFDNDLPREICEDLAQQNISSIFIEGGAATLQSFIDADLWDEARVFSSHAVSGDGVKAPVIMKTPASRLSVGNNHLSIYRNDK